MSGEDNQEVLCGVLRNDSQNGRNLESLRPQLYHHENDQQERERV